MAKTRTDSPFTITEWNASGAIHFYDTNQPRSFNIEVETTEDVQGDVLQQAVDTTLQRMPYFGQTFVRRHGLFYYAENPLPMCVVQTEVPRVIGGESTNYHMLDVTYYKRTIRFAMFHGFCDGIGHNRFVEAVLYHYFCLKDGKEYSDEGIVTSKVPYDPAEVEDTVARSYKVKAKDLQKLTNPEKRFRLPELDEDRGLKPFVHDLPVAIQAEELLSWCKACGGSPATAMAAFMAKAVAREHEVSEGVVTAMVLNSLRKGLHAEKTFKNCVGELFLNVEPEQARTLPSGELAAQMRQTLIEQNTDEKAVLSGAGTSMLVNAGKKMPTFFLKKKVLGIQESHCLDTFIVDYVGSITTNDYTDQIANISYLNADNASGSMTIFMLEHAGTFVASVRQSFETDRYYKVFCAVLDEEGIAYEKLPVRSYLNPHVELPREQR